jgi:Ribbon-helix-helix protein, copG family
MVRTQVQLTEKQANTLKNLAASRYLSIAELIRQAVDTFIKSSSGIDIEERKKKALEIAGRFRSGKHDVSSKHDNYLSEAFRK